jgi:hypothetical protein
VHGHKFHVSVDCRLSGYLEEDTLIWSIILCGWAVSWCRILGEMDAGGLQA